MQYLAHPFDGMFDVIVPPRFLFGAIVPPRIQHPLWFGSLLDLPAPFVMMLLSFRSEFDASFVAFAGSKHSLGRSSLFMWLNVSWRGSWLNLFFACA